MEDEEVLLSKMKLSMRMMTLSNLREKRKLVRHNLAMAKNLNIANFGEDKKKKGVGVMVEVVE
jgi:uncharacterized protein YlxP (DUF503 family)